MAQQYEEVVISGVISDASNKQVLEYANVVAVDTSQLDEDLHFTMTNEKGFYTLKLKKGLPYRLEISYLGYEKIEQIVVLSEDTNLNFAMEVAENELGEVIVESTIPPIIYKEDTILYNASSFADGTERKLRELLEQMPNVEVDENDNIFVEGKKVTKLLVEGKPFFGGSSELAVKSIPADAVKTVEVLKEYNEIAFLNPVADDNELAMNIKLKEDKKKFVFGEVKAGGGWKKRGEAQSDLFYYSPKVNLYSIAGINNLNNEILTMQQLIELQGGVSKLLNNKGGLSFGNNNIFRYLSPPSDKVANQSAVAALGSDLMFSKHWQFNVFGIYSNIKKRSRSTSLNQYFLEDNFIFEEFREFNQADNNNWLLTQADIVYQKNDKDHLSVKVETATSQSNYNQDIQSFGVDTSNINTNSNNRPNDMRFSLDWNRKSNTKHISTTKINANWNTRDERTTWTDLDNPFLEEYLLWIVDDSSYTAIQEEDIFKTTLQGSFKHYYIINNKNHFSGEVTYNFINNTLDISSFQSLADGSINDWDNAATNDLNLNFHHLYGKFAYRHKRDRTELKLGITSHELHRKETGTYNEKNRYAFIQPFFELNTTIPKIGELDFKYSQHRELPRISRLYPNAVLGGFTSITQGVPDLGLESSHDVSLTLGKVNIFKHSNIFIRTSLTLLDRSIRAKTETSEISRLSSFYMTTRLHYRARAIIRYSKDFGVLKISPTINWSASSSESIINDILFQSKRNSLRLGINATYKVKKRKRISLDYQRAFTWYQQSQITTLNTFDKINTRLVLGINKAWLLKADYDFIYFSGGDSSINHLLNGSLEYHKEDSPFYFTLSWHNILNNKFNQSQSTSTTFISNQTSFIFPAYALFSCTYHL